MDALVYTKNGQTRLARTWRSIALLVLDGWTLASSGAAPSASDGTQIGTSRIEDGMIVVDFLSPYGINADGPYFVQGGYAAPGEGAILHIRDDGVAVITKPIGAMA